MKTRNHSRNVAGIILCGALAVSALFEARTEAAAALNAPPQMQPRQQNTPKTTKTTPREIRKLGGDAPAPAPAAAAAGNGASQASVKEKLANIERLNKDMLAWKPNAAGAAELKPRLKSELVATLSGKQTPSAESVDKLSGDLIDFAAAGKLTPKQVLAIQKTTQGYLDKRTLSANDVDGIKAEIATVARSSMLSREEAAQLAQDAEALVKSARASAPPLPKLEGLKDRTGATSDSRKLTKPGARTLN